jgi:hypothetical protein
MDRPAHRMALAVACAFLGLFGLLPAAASATTNNYCGVLIANGTPCGDFTNHFYTFNSASYTGAGSVWVCERLLVADTTTLRASPVCSYTYASATFPVYATASEAEVAHYTGTNHTIYGSANY